MRTNIMMRTAKLDEHVFTGVYSSEESTGKRILLKIFLHHKSQMGIDMITKFLIIQ